MPVKAAKEKTRYKIIRRGFYRVQKIWSLNIKAIELR